MKKKLLAFVLILAILCGSFFVYTGIYYHADETTVSVLENNKASIKQLDNALVFEPEEYDAAFIFYPGGKVEYTAYAPLMEELAQKNILCILLKVPFNLAVLKPDTADGFVEQFPEVKNWWIGGHSLGGTIASIYVGKHSDVFSKLIFLGAYSSVDLSDTDIEVVSILGSNDGIINTKNYNKNLCKLPTDFREITIEGGCHSYFGSYGMQKGDGEPTISAEEQRNQIVKAIVE